MTHSIETTPPTLADLAAESFLAPYAGNTRVLYSHLLGSWFAWCDTQHLDPLAATRHHIEAYYRYRTDTHHNSPATLGTTGSVLKGFYKLALGDDLVTKNPVEYARRPKARVDPSARHWLSRTELQRFLMAARIISPRHDALAHLLAVLGLRVSEACNVQIEDYQHDVGGHRVLQLVGKGNKAARVPIPIPVIRALETVRGDRTSGQLLTTLDGRPLTRHGANGLVTTICHRANLPEIRSHTLRRSAITAALDSGVPLRDVQHYARHADPKTTMTYDRGQASLDRHAVHVVSAFITA